MRMPLHDAAAGDTAHRATGWQGQLQLHYRRDGERTVAHDRHSGPLRVLRPLHPEGPAICHHVLVHPPGGIVGGDRLDIELDLAEGSHALLTTPGATRFYRSAGETAMQTLRARVASGARLEWLPLETIAYRSARAVNQLDFDLAPDAEMIGWDLLALGLPASGETFDHGRYEQRLALCGHWLERGVLDFDQPRSAQLTRRLLDSPLGWSSRSVLATVWWASGSDIAAARAQRLLDAARELSSAATAGEGMLVGVTAPNPRVVVARMLAHRTEAPWKLMQQLRAAWRTEQWGLQEVAPRIWRT